MNCTSASEHQAIACYPRGLRTTCQTKRQLGTPSLSLQTVQGPAAVSCRPKNEEPANHARLGRLALGVDHLNCDFVRSRDGGDPAVGSAVEQHFTQLVDRDPVCESSRGYAN